MSRDRPDAKPYVSPITVEERMANSLLRAAKRFERLGIPFSASQTELDEVKAERDRLWRLRGYGSKKRRSFTSAQ